MKPKYFSGMSEYCGDDLKHDYTEVNALIRKYNRIINTFDTYEDQVNFDYVVRLEMDEILNKMDKHSMNRITKEYVSEIKRQLDREKLSDGEYVILIHKNVFGRGRIAVSAFQNFKDFEENVQRVSDEIIANDPSNGIYIEWVSFD